MSEIITKQINQLIEKGFKLAESYGDLNSPGAMEWYQTCGALITSLYGKPSKEYDGFRRAKFPHGHLMILQTLLDKIPNTKTHSSTPSTVINVNQTQITTVQNEIYLNILLNIDHSALTELQKEEAKELSEEVKEEVQKPDTNWSKVTELLKKSFDYGLKIAPDIVKLADAYYKAKGGK